MTVRIGASSPVRRQRTAGSAQTAHSQHASTTAVSNR